MREIKDTRPAKTSEEYKRPGGRAEADKISPLRGLRIRWVFDRGDDGSFVFFRTRADAMRFRRTYRLSTLPRRVHV